jgi:membrane protease YdiL (CAAX protease family)
MDVFRDRPVLAFFGLTMAISWGLWWPIAGGYVESAVAERVAVFGPTIAALVLTGYLHGREGIIRLGRRLLHWRVGPRWYLFSVGFSPALLLVAVGIHRAMGGSLPPLSLPDLPIIVLGFVYVLLTSVVGEELGWRGFALPRLQRSYSALVASLLLGLVWFLWHLPLFYTAGDFHRFIPLELFVLQIVGFSVLYTWLFNSTDGSLVFPHLFHTVNNFTFFVFPVLPTDPTDSTRPLWVGIGLLWLVVVVVVFVTGPESLSRAASKVTYLDRTPRERS